MPRWWKLDKENVEAIMRRAQRTAVLGCFPVPKFLRASPSDISLRDVSAMEDKSNVVTRDNTGHPHYAATVCCPTFEMEDLVILGQRTAMHAGGAPPSGNSSPEPVVEISLDPKPTILSCALLQEWNPNVPTRKPEADILRELREQRIIPAAPVGTRGGSTWDIVPAFPKEITCLIPRRLAALDVRKEKKKITLEKINNKMLLAENRREKEKIKKSNRNAKKANQRKRKEKKQTDDLKEAIMMKQRAAAQRREEALMKKIAPSIEALERVHSRAGAAGAASPAWELEGKLDNKQAAALKRRERLQERKLSALRGHHSDVHLRAASRAASRIEALPDVETPEMVEMASPPPPPPTPPQEEGEMPDDLHDDHDAEIEAVTGIPEEDGEEAEMSSSSWSVYVPTLLEQHRARPRAARLPRTLPVVIQHSSPGLEVPIHPMPAVRQKSSPALEVPTHSIRTPSCSDLGDVAASSQQDKVEVRDLPASPRRIGAAAASPLTQQEEAGDVMDPPDMEVLVLPAEEHRPASRMTPAAASKAHMKKPSFLKRLRRFFSKPRPSTECGDRYGVPSIPEEPKGKPAQPKQKRWGLFSRNNKVAPLPQ